jgi:hypothetical protein
MNFSLVIVAFEKKKCFFKNAITVMDFKGGVNETHHEAHRLCFQIILIKVRNYGITTHLFSNFN